MGSFLLEKEGKTPWTNVVDEPYYSVAKTVPLRAGRRSEREARGFVMGQNLPLADIDDGEDCFLLAMKVSVPCVAGVYQEAMRRADTACAFGSPWSRIGPRASPYKPTVPSAAGSRCCVGTSDGLVGPP